MARGRPRPQSPGASPGDHSANRNAGLRPAGHTAVPAVPARRRRNRPAGRRRPTRRARRPRDLLALRSVTILFRLPPLSFAPREVNDMRKLLLLLVFMATAAQAALPVPKLDY